MPTWIQLTTGEGWCSSDTPEAVKAAITQGLGVPIWWFSPWGQRYAETLFVEPELIAFVRTESDDG